MTTLAETKQILKGYYAAVASARMDLEDISRYTQFSLEDRAGKRDVFAAWFAHHAQMYVDVQIFGEREFFYVELGEVMKDAAFFDHLRSQQDEIRRLRKDIELLLKQRGDDTELMHKLDRYTGVVTRYIDDSEVVFIPKLMQCYTRETFKTLEAKYVKTLKGSSTFLPWALARLSVADRESFLQSLPLPIRFLYRHFWEPAYKKRYFVAV